MRALSRPVDVFVKILGTTVLVSSRSLHRDRSKFYLCLFF